MSGRGGGVEPTVRGLGELDFIARVCRPAFARTLRSAPGRGWRVDAGIGDDTAVLRTPEGRQLLFASDMLVEGTHFRFGDTPSQWIGWKALARNLSDIAAMGGVPIAAVVSLGLPANFPASAARELYSGLSRCARRFRTALIGGDTTRAKALVVDVAILGEAGPRGPILRNGARAGDELFVTGRLGGAVRSGKHARFMPRVAEAQAILKASPVHAMIDLSDGLASGLWHIAAESGVILEVETASIPLAASAQGIVSALNDGEDFELLFAVPSKTARHVPKRLGRCAVTRVGRVVRGKPSVFLLDERGRRLPVRSRGFTHFER